MTDSPEDQRYRRFFQQLSVLDALRVYIDLNEDFLNDLLTHQVLTQEQLGFIKTLPWPSSRNELLQMFVKKDWRKDSFEKFYSTLVRTQKSLMVDLLAANLQETLSDNGRQTTRENGTVSTPLSPNDPMFEPLSFQYKMQVIVQMREKDAHISRLVSRNEYLEKTLKVRSTELLQQTTRNECTDKLLENWTAELKLSDSSASVSTLDEPSGADVATTLSRVKASLCASELKIAKLEEENASLKSSVAVLERERQALKEENETLLDERKRMKQKFVKSMEELKRSTVSLSSGSAEIPPKLDGAISTSPNSCEKTVSPSASVAAAGRKPLPKLTELKKKSLRKSSDVTPPAFAAVQKQETRRISMPSMTGNRLASGGSLPQKH